MTGKQPSTSSRALLAVAILATLVTGFYGWAVVGFPCMPVTRPLLVVLVLLSVPALRGNAVVGFFLEVSAWGSAFSFCDANPFNEHLASIEAPVALLEHLSIAGSFCLVGLILGLRANGSTVGGQKFKEFLVRKR